MKPYTVDTKWHWFRYEYQGRGSIHCHGTAKVPNDPGLCQLIEIALKGFWTQKQMDKGDSVNTQQLDQDIEAGKNTTHKVCPYVDWLLSTVNPNPPHENMWMRPVLHPCQKPHEDVLDFELDNDYADLLNMVQ